MTNSIMFMFCFALCIILFCFALFCALHCFALCRFTTTTNAILLPLQLPLLLDYST